MAKKNPHPLHTIARPAIKAAWGFYPDRDIKVVHLANGFFKHLCAWSSSEVELLKAVAASRRGQSRKTAGDVLQMPGFKKAAEITVPKPVAEEATERLRQALDEVLNQDGAFYYLARNSTLTLTHRQHISADTYDQEAGSLLAQVLLAAPDQAAVTALRQALDTPDNTIYRLTQPLLTPPANTLELQQPKQATPEVRARLADSCVLPGWQTSFTTLAAHYLAPAPGREALGKTAFLQRAATLAGLGLLLHLYNAGPGSGCQPLLLCADDPLPAVREASRRALGQARKRLRGAFREALRAELTRRKNPARPDDYQAWATEWLLEAERAQYVAELAEAKNQGTPDFEAAVRALTGPGLKAAGSKSAEGCASSLGQRLGLQWPRRQGTGQPYLSPVPAVYDALVSGLLTPGQVVPLEEFWELAYERFGLLCGAGLPDDQTRLAQVGIRNVSLDDLQTNARAVLDELRRLGYARTYADEVTLISAGW